MKAVLMGIDGEIFYLDIPEQHRGNIYNIPDRIRPYSTTVGPVMPIKVGVRTFRWRAQVNSTLDYQKHLFDIFEETPS